MKNENGIIYIENSGKTYFVVDYSEIGMVFYLEITMEKFIKEFVQPLKSYETTEKSKVITILNRFPWYGFCMKDGVRLDGFQIPNYSKVYYQLNKQQMYENQKRCNAKRPKELKRYMENYYTDNRPILKMRSRNYYWKNRENILNKKAKERRLKKSIESNDPIDLT